MNHKLFGVTIKLLTAGRHPVPVEHNQFISDFSLKLAEGQARLIARNLAGSEKHRGFNYRPATIKSIEVIPFHS